MLEVICLRKHRECHKHGEGPCSCEMGNLYRFVEPIVLVSLARLGKAHGYQIAQEAERLAVTHAGVDIPAVYRTLRRLESMEYAESSWDTDRPGPARREYSLTPKGRDHLVEWTAVLKDFTLSLNGILELCSEIKEGMKDDKKQ